MAAVTRHKFHFTSEEEDQETAADTKFEKVLKKAGLFGRYQIFCCLIVQYASIQWAGNYSFMPSLGTIYPSEWNCTKSNGQDLILTSSAHNTSQLCKEQESCETLTAKEYDFKSLIPEWHLICDNERIPDYMFSIYLLGQLVGSLIGGHIGDYIGRKRGLMGSQFATIVTSVMSIASTTWYAFAICQFFCGFFLGVTEMTALTLLMEVTDCKYRVIPNAFFQWTFGYIVLSLTAFLTKEWRLYFIFGNLFAAPLIIGFLLFQESPRWLIVRGNLERASMALTEMGNRWNNKGAIFSAKDLEGMPRDEWRYHTVIDIFRNRPLAIQTILLMSTLFVHDLLSDAYTTSLRAIDFKGGGGIFLEMFLFGLLRAPIPFIIVFVDIKFKKFGRRTLLLLGLAINGITMMVCLCLLIFNMSPDHPAVITLTIIGQLNNESTLYMAVIQIGARAYPTVIRCIAYGTLHAAMHLGGIVNTLGLKQINQYWLPGIYLVPGLLTCVLFVAAFYQQQETKGQHMPDRIGDHHFVIKNIVTQTSME